MIAHVVLFRPKADLAPEAAEDLLRAFEQAIRSIPSLRRANIGRRVRIGREYEQLMAGDYPYAAVLEFDDVAGLRAYLDHPAHAAVGAAVFAAAADLLVYDFDMSEGQSEISRLLGQT